MLLPGPGEGFLRGGTLCCPAA